MRGLIPVAALASLAGCATVAPLDEAERARVRVVAPAAARFAPNVDFNVPPGKAEGAAAGGALGLLYGSQCAMLLWPPYIITCAAIFTGASAVIGAAGTPSNEGIEAQVERARSQLGAPDVQQLLVQRFSERVTRLTSYTIDLSTSKHGPQSPTDEPSYSGAAAGEGTLIAELAVESVGATLVEPGELTRGFAGDYAARPLRIRLNARMRLIRPWDGGMLMTRYYSVARYGRRIQEYHEDGTRLLRAIAGAIDEAATRMVDDAFLLRFDAASAGSASAPVVTALEPRPSGQCRARGPFTYDCWAYQRVPRLDTVSPTFRWQPFPELSHFETAPWLRAARNLVYDLWILGGEDDRVVEGLTTTEHALERPLANCMRYSWAVRARFDTDAGPRTVKWSAVSRFSSGMPFMTPCPDKTDGTQPSADKR